MAVVPLRSGGPTQPSAVVMGMCINVDEAGTYLVRHDEGVLWRCRRAASCLLQPQVGDEVMVCGPDADRMYLIAVVEQAVPREARLDVPGDLVLNVPHGDLRLESAGAIQAFAQGAVNLAGDALRLEAAHGEIRIERLRFLGRTVSATVGVFKHVGKTIEQMVDRVTQSSRSSTRVVAGLDLVRAGQVDLEAGGAMRLHGRTAMVTGEDLVKVDAEQIHMG